MSLTSVWILYNEEWYGGGCDFIKAFKTREDAEAAINDSLNLDQLVTEFKDVNVVDGNIYITYTEECYGDIQVHSKLKEAESRINNAKVDTLVIRIPVL